MKYRYKLLSLPIVFTMAIGVLYACGSGARTCAGADPLVQTVALVDRGGSGSSAGSSGAHSSGGISSSGGRSSSGAPANSGVRASSGSSGSPSARSSSGAPANSGVKSGANAGPPANSGAHSTPIPTAAPIPGGRVPSYAGPSKISGTYYSPSHVVYVYHPATYWASQPLDANNPFDQRNYDNPFSPYFHRHVLVKC